MPAGGEAFTLLTTWGVSARTPRAAANASDDAVLSQTRHRGGVEAKPVGKYFGGMLAEQWRRFDGGRDTVKAHRPGRHRHRALAMRHRLQDAALPEAGFVDQLLRIEHCTGRYADRAQLCHRLVLRALAGPGGDDLVDLSLAFDAGVGGIVPRVADQILAPQQLQQARPMLGVGTAGQQVDVVVGTAWLARVDAARRVVGGRPARRCPAGTGLSDEPAAAVMHHRILHRHLQPPALSRARTIGSSLERTRL